MDDVTRHWFGGSALAVGESLELRRPKTRHEVGSIDLERREEKIRRENPPNFTKNSQDLPMGILTNLSDAPKKERNGKEGVKGRSYINSDQLAPPHLPRPNNRCATLYPRGPLL